MTWAKKSRPTEFFGVAVGVVGLMLLLWYSWGNVNNVMCDSGSLISSQAAPSSSSLPPAAASKETQPFQHPDSHTQDTSGSFYASDALPDNRPQAVVIETVMTANLIPLMLHFSTVLGPTWMVTLYTLKKHWEEPSSPAFRRAVEAQRVQVRFLPEGTELSDSRSVSRFLTRPWLWENLQFAKRVLLFQTDSIICSKASSTAEDFLSYDFVGAPIDEKYGEGYNGGLSLRNPVLFLQIANEANFEESGAEFEDQWFYREAKARENEGVTLPSVEVAKTFSVETIYYDKPLGYHQAARWQADKMEDIEQYCPEVKMLVGRRAL